MNPLPLFQMSLNTSQDHFSIGNVAKLKCDMGYVVNDQVNDKQKNDESVLFEKLNLFLLIFSWASSWQIIYGIGLTLRFVGENYFNEYNKKQDTIKRTS